ncbi:MAG: rRNA maturation RNase YbeY, partial [Rhizobiales bacterium 35-66-30]
MGRGATSVSSPAPDRFAVDILVEDARWDGVPDAPALAERAAQAALAACGDGFARAAEMSVTLTDDARIRVLNRQWREK